MSVSRDVQNLIFYAFLIAWMGVGAFLFMRMRLLQSAYIRRFTHINYFLGDPIFVVASLRDARYAHRIMRDPQPDAELEQIRREIWRRFRHCLIWIYGFLVFAVALAAHLIAPGLVHLQ